LNVNDNKTVICNVYVNKKRNVSLRLVIAAIHDSLYFENISFQQLYKCYQVQNYICTSNPSKLTTCNLKGVEDIDY